MNPDIDRATFRAHVSLSRQLLEDGNLTASDEEATRGARVAEIWEEQGRIFDLLDPLLDDREPESMRFAAAAYLLEHGYEDEAVPVLERIRDEDGPAAAAARALLVDRPAEPAD